MQKKNGPQCLTPNHMISYLSCFTLMKKITILMISYKIINESNNASANFKCDLNTYSLNFHIWTTDTFTYMKTLNSFSRLLKPWKYLKIHQILY